MKARLEAWLLRRWYGGVAPGPLLRLLAWLYGRLSARRRRRDAAAAASPGVPVLVVGNLVAGGAGKTPLTIALARELARRGWSPGIVSRGHGRQGRAPLRVEAGMSPTRCGDEPLLIAERTGLPVFVDRDRLAAAAAAVAAGCNLVIADDGLQHLRLARDIEIEVVDGERRYGNGRLLPAGPLREPAGRPVDFRVVNGGSAGEGERPMRLQPGPARALEGGATRPLQAFAGQPVHAVAGIGHPRRFFQTLRAAGLEPIGHAFPDHHAYRREDLAFTPPLPLLMTEKDAVKCRGLGLAEAWSVPVEAQLPDTFYDAVAARLAALDNRHAPA
ncbi:MAG TPA: tetraacyldisaccharide 4'-kinase [Arenimonas sp.]|nr:tetraacyldisaccharide 4'-kinase [Arenimonas sp.]